MSKKPPPPELPPVADIIKVLETTKSLSRTLERDAQRVGLHELALLIGMVHTSSIESLAQYKNTPAPLETA